MILTGPATLGENSRQIIFGDDRANQLQGGNQTDHLYGGAGGDLLTDALGDLAMSFVRYAPGKPPLPDTVDELSAIVEQVDGVRFRQLVEVLAHDGGADGDEALHAALGMAQYMAG